MAEPDPIPKAGPSFEASDPRIDQLSREMAELKSLIQTLAVASGTGQTAKEKRTRSTSKASGKTPIAHRTRSRVPAIAAQTEALQKLAGGVGAGGLTGEGSGDRPKDGEGVLPGSRGRGAQTTGGDVIFRGDNTGNDDSESDPEDFSDQEREGSDAGGNVDGAKASVLPPGGLFLDDEYALWADLIVAVASFRLLSKKERTRRFREALGDMVVTDQYLGYLADFYWGSLSLAKFLPPTLRGAEEDESEYAELKVTADGRTRVEFKRRGSSKVGGLSLRAPEWQRGIMVFVDAHCRAVSPVFSTWGLRYMTWFLEYMDGGYSWAALLRAEHDARKEIGRELRTLTRGAGARGHRHWRAIGDDAMRHKLAVNPGFKPEASPAAGGGAKQGKR